MMLLRHNLTSFSLAFLLVGMPILYTLREYVPFPKELFSYVITTLFLFFMVDYRNLIRFKFFTNKPLLLRLLLILNLTLFLLYSVVSTNFFNHKESIYLLVLLFIIIALNTHKKNDFLSLPLYVLMVSTISTYISIALNPISMDYWALHGGRFYVGDTHNPNLTSFVALINVLSIIYAFYHQKSINMILKLFLLFSIGLSFYLYIISFSKSAILGLFFSMLFLMIIDKSFSKFMMKKVFILISTVIFFIVLFLPDLMNSIFKMFEVLQASYNSYFYGTNENMSADMRYNNLTRAFQQLKDIDIFSGFGMYTTRADLPLLQVFTDLGIISGVLNFVVMIFLPFIIIIKNIRILKYCSNDQSYKLAVFAIVIYLFYLPNSLLHGTPYDYGFWLVILVVYKFTYWNIHVSERMKNNV